MTKSCLSVAIALFIGVALSAQTAPARPIGPQAGPDLSGRWTREGAGGGADNPGWGPQVEIKQSGVHVTVQPPSGKPQRFRLDAWETAEVLSVEGCKNQIRITKSVPDRDRVTITTWLATKSGCVHGETDCEPLTKLIGEVAADKVRGRRQLESITVISRDGNAMTVDTTRSNPGDVPTSTTTTYRK